MSSEGALHSVGMSTEENLSYSHSEGAPEPATRKKRRNGPTIEQQEEDVKALLLAVFSKPEIKLLLQDVNSKHGKNTVLSKEGKEKTIAVLVQEVLQARELGAYELLRWMLENIESVKKENLTKGLEKLGREGKVVIAARLNEMLGGKKAQKTETASSPHSRGTPDTKKGKKRQAKKTAGNDDWFGQTWQYVKSFFWK